MEIIAVLIIIALLVVIEQIIFRKYALKGVSYTVKFSCEEAFEGDTFEIVEEIVNDKGLPVPWIKTEISTSRWLMFTGSSAARGSDARFVPSVFSMRPRSKCTRTRRVTALKRGSFSLDNVTLVACDLLGTLSISAAVHIDAKVRILPAPYELAEGDLSETELYGEILARRFICDDPFYVSGAREYTGREPMNRLHWQGTARTGRIMARSCDFTTTRRGLILLNMQKASGGEPRPIITGDLETYIKAAAFLIDMLAGQRVSADFATNGSVSGGVYAEGGTGRESYIGLLRELCGLTEYCDRGFPEFAESLDFKGKTDVFIITAYIDEKMLALAQTLRRQGINTVFYCNSEEVGEVQLLRVGRVNRYYFMNGEE